MDFIVSVSAKVANFRALAERVVSLPEPFRPSYFSPGGRVRDKAASRVDDGARFQAFLDDRVTRVSGFDLVGSGIQFGFFVGATRNARHQSTHIGCSVLLRGRSWKPADLEALLRALSASPGVDLADACSRDEWKFRHMSFKQFEVISVEQSLGVDISAFLPGLYWWTAFSDELVYRHRLDIGELEQFSGHYEQWPTDGGGMLHAFRLFDRPDQWHDESGRISAFLEAHPNFFSMTRLRAQIDASKTKDELDALVRPFRAGARPWECPSTSPS